MESFVKIYHIDSPIFESERTVSEKLEQSHLCFYRFIGGNSSETKNLTTQLRTLKEKNGLLIGIFRFPFRFEGKRRMQTATLQYYRMKELCDAIIYFNSDGLLETIESTTKIRDAHLTFTAIEDYTIQSLRDMIEMTGEMNIDIKDIQTFIKANKGALFIHTIDEESFDEPLKDLISLPYLPVDFMDGKQFILNIGYTRDVDMEAFRQINLRLNDLFSKADLVKLGSFYIDEPGQRFKITFLVNGIKDPFDIPEDYKKLPKYKEWFKKWQFIAEKSWKRLNIG